MAIMKACRDFDFLVSFLGDDGRGRGDGGASGCLEQLEFAIRSATGESWIYRFESYENNVWCLFSENKLSFDKLLSRCDN